MIYLTVHDTANDARFATGYILKLKQRIDNLIIAHGLTKNQVAIEEYMILLKAQIKTNLVSNLQAKTGRQFSISKDQAELFSGNANSFGSVDHRYGEIIDSLLGPLTRERTQNWIYEQRFSTSFIEYAGITTNDIELNLSVYFSNLRDILFSGIIPQFTPPERIFKYLSGNLMDVYETITEEFKNIIFEVRRETFDKTLLSARIEILIVPEEFSPDRTLVRNQPEYSRKIAHIMADETNQKAESLGWRFQKFQIDTETLG